MLVNDLALPDTFLRDVANGRFYRARGSWPLHEERDAYDNHLETELAVVYATAEDIVQQTRELPKGFELDGLYGRHEEQDAPGFIPDIIDFSLIICFGMSGDSAPFCFDFRDDLRNPSVVWWDDWYWRRIAPDYETFIGLFDMR